MSRKSFRYYRKLASKPGQTKSSLYRRLKRRWRDWRKRNKKVISSVEREQDFLDLVDQKQKEIQAREEKKDEQESS